MANENVERRDSLENIKALDKFRDATVRPLMDSIKQMRSAIGALSSSINTQRAKIAEDRERQRDEEIRRQLAAEEQKLEERLAGGDAEQFESKLTETPAVVEEVAPIVEAVVEEPVAPQAEPVQPVVEAVIEEPVPTPPAQEAKVEEKYEEPPTPQPFVKKITSEYVERRIADIRNRANGVQPERRPQQTSRDGFVPRNPDTRPPRDNREPRPAGTAPRTDGARPQNTRSVATNGFVERVNIAQNSPTGVDKRGYQPRRPAPRDGQNNEQQKKKSAKGKSTVIYDVSDYDENGELIDKSVKGRRGKSKQQTYAQPVIKIEKAVITTENVSIKQLSEKIGKTATEIVKQLFMQGIMKTINDTITFEQAELVAMEFGIELEKKLDQTFEERLEASSIGIDLDIDENAVRRPPIVTIMGHVDHGKTSLLDYIRNANVVSGEAGGITQHIGAYTANINGATVTFLDTPGHSAFTAMRARGAQVTDIAVIVVAVDDGVMPQTIEAINHARQANVAIVIAINKIDKIPQPDRLAANIERVKNELSGQGIVFEEWGGNDICVPVSASTGKGVPELLENLVLLAEVLELKANPDAMARGAVIESKLDKARGPLATVLVQNGTLHVADFLVAGSVTGKVRALFDSKGRAVREAGPSMPVVVLGFSDVPSAGDTVIASNDEKLIRQVAEERKQKEKDAVVASSGASSLEDVYARISSGQIKDLNLILKTDVHGSVEAIKTELTKLSNEEVKVNIIHSGVGAINESDVILASTAGAIIIGFNVRPDTNAKALADKNKIDIRSYRIIYDIKNDIEMALKGMLAPKFEEHVIGKAEIRNTFRITGVGIIAGCYVTSGKVVRQAQLRLLRDNVIVFEGKVGSLRRGKDDVKEVQQGYECGIGVENYNDVKEGDTFEFFVMNEIKD